MGLEIRMFFDELALLSKVLFKLVKGGIHVVDVRIRLRHTSHGNPEGREDIDDGVSIVIAVPNSKCIVRTDLEPLIGVTAFFMSTELLDGNESSFE